MSQTEQGRTEPIRYATDDSEDAVGVPDSAPPEETPGEHRDHTKRTVGEAAIAGGVIGAVAGPIGAVAGAAIGAVIGESNASDEDRPDTTGNVTEEGHPRVKRTYDGQIYEEGSLHDVRRKDEI